MRKNALICLFCLIESGLFGQDVPYGREFQISADDQYSDMDGSRAVGLPDGGFVVCWLRGRGDGGHDIVGQLFDSRGEKRGKELSIDACNDAFSPTVSVAGLPQGFVVCWNQWSPESITNRAVNGQIYDMSGNVVKERFRVTPDSLFDFPNFNMIRLSSGNFAVCWEDFYPYGQVFSASGQKIGSEFNLDGGLSNIGAFSDGGFLVCFYYWDGNQKELYGQRFNPSGEPEGAEFMIYSSFEGYITRPKLASLAEGGLAVGWIDDEQDYSSSHLMVRIVDTSGRMRDDAFQVTAFPDASAIHRYDMAGLSDGGFVVCWDAETLYRDDLDVRAQVYNEFGVKRGDEFRVNHTVPGDQYGPWIAALAGSGYAVCWNDGGIRAKLLPSSPLRHDLKPFSLIGPLNDATENALPISFSWNQATVQTICYPWEMTYDLCISIDPEYSSPFVVRGIEDTTCVIDHLRPGATYFWKVLARNVAGDSLWSEPTDWGFYILPGDSTAVQYPTFREFVLVNPVQEVGLERGETPLNWRRASVEETVYPPLVFYNVYVADNPDFTAARTVRAINDTTCTVGGLSAAGTYYWKVEAYDSEGDSLWSRDVGQIRVTSVEPEIPDRFQLCPNFPNPFNSGTSIRLDVPEAAEVCLDIFDIRGKRIVRLFDGKLEPGSRWIPWMGTDAAGDRVASGIYICRMEARSAGGRRFVQSVKMGLVR
jgi:hypothetical protein